ALRARGAARGRRDAIREPARRLGCPAARDADAPGRPRRRPLVRLLARAHRAGAAAARAGGGAAAREAAARARQPCHRPQGRLSRVARVVHRRHAGRRRAPAGDRLAALWTQPGIVRMPGAHTPLAALLARRAGFPALYLSGAAVTASLALPDLGVLALDELVFFTRAICRAVDLPLLVDGDTGYGEALNVMRLVRELEDAGAAAVQLEDQVLPKKCGHLSDKRLATPEDMARKVAAAARASRHLRLIARPDALASEA